VITLLSGLSDVAKGAGAAPFMGLFGYSWALWTSRGVVARRGATR
jgi:hypothetical protein